MDQSNERKYMHSNSYPLFNHSILKNCKILWKQKRTRKGTEHKIWVAFFSTCFVTTFIQCAMLRMHTEMHRIYFNYLLYFMLPKYLYATENKVASNLHFLRLFYILLPIFQKFLKMKNTIQIENSFLILMIPRFPMVLAVPVNLNTVTLLYTVSELCPSSCIQKRKQSFRNCYQL